jgi:hypothetical protein
MLIYVFIMSLLSPHQLDVLTARLELFRPSGLNDALRQDLTAGEAFAAIDTRSPNEIDDAVRVRMRRGGGFIVQLAVADGSQIAHGSELVRDAMASKESIYRGKRCVESMLPDLVIRQLELSPARNPQRAMVVESQYDADAAPDGEAQVYPATVRVDAYRQAEFASKYLRKEGPNAPVAQFVERFRATRDDLSYELPQALGGPQNNATYGSQLVQDYVVLANHGFTRYGQDRGIPLIHHSYPDVQSTWGMSKGRLDPALYVLSGEHTGDVAYARATSPLHEGVSLANHLLFGAHVAGAEADELARMASAMHGQLQTD